MTTLREAAQQALEALDCPGKAKTADEQAAITALRAALAEPHTGVMLKPVLYANRRLTNEEVDAVVERKENT